MLQTESVKPVVVPQTERRRSPRFKLALPVRVLGISGKAVNLPGTTWDLSAGGAYFVIDGDVEPGAAIEFIVTLQSVKNIQLRCRGRVTRAERMQTESRLKVATTIRRYQFVRDGATPLKETLARPSPLPPDTEW